MRSEIFRKLPGFLGVLFFVSVFFGCGQADTYDYGEVLEERAKDRDTADVSALEYAPSEASDAQEPSAREENRQDQACIYVQVCGAVKSPGVYELPPGARVFEAIEKSGGLAENAAPDAVNQAAVVSDGGLIRIPTTEEWEKESASGGLEPAVQTGGEEAVSAGEDRIDINQADMQTLMTLPGIGQSRAEGIIDYRREHGGFKTTEELQQVSGIGDKLFQKIKDKIRV